MSTAFVENTPATKAPAKHLPDATRKRILNSVVKLFATARGNTSSPLTASGVIFNVVGNNVQILTALHNILMWGKLNAPPADAALLAAFAANLTVYYGKGDLTFNSEVLTNKCKKTPSTDPFTVTVPNVPSVAACAGTKGPVVSMYDLALITCTDSAFATYAKNSVLGSNFKFQDAVTGIINETNALLTKPYACIQLGYGVLKEKRTKLTYVSQTKKLAVAAAEKGKSNPETREAEKAAGMIDYHLHYRVTKLKNTSSTCRFNLDTEAGKAPEYTAYAETFEVSVNGGTSAPGDSGGPLYLVDVADMTKAYLLGVTTGSDMEASDTVPTEIFYNDISTSVLPYFETLKPPPPPKK